jgi:thioester reductase-like protein
VATQYLVTGFPYFRGRKVLCHLLRAEPSSGIVAVVPPEQGTAARRVIDELEASDRCRVEILDGDPAAIDLGLSGTEYRSLADRVTRIHHAAPVTGPVTDRRVAEAVNVGGMREIIELGRACRALESIVVYSSARVSGSRTGLVLEQELQAGQSFRSPVDQSLALAEKMARDAMGDLPIAVIRPTQIIGDSITGEVERFDGLYLLILLIVSSPQEFPRLLPTRGDVPLHVVPIDYVVRAAHHIGLRPETAGRTFHLVDPSPLRVRRVFELMAERGSKALPKGPIPASLVWTLFGAAGVSLASKSPKVLLDLIATHVSYATENTDRILAGSSITCPPFESYLDHVVDYVKSRMDLQQGAQVGAS